MIFIGRGHFTADDIAAAERLVNAHDARVLEKAKRHALSRGLVWPPPQPGRPAPVSRSRPAPKQSPTRQASARPLRWPSDEDRRLAIHEAGHAVVGLHHGSQPIQMLLHENGGVTFFEGCSHLSSEQRLDIDVAGAAAVSRLLNEYWPPAGDDLESMLGTIRGMGIYDARPAIAAAERRANVILSRHWTAATLMAYQLRSAGELRTADMNLLFRTFQHLG